MFRKRRVVPQRAFKSSCSANLSFRAQLEHTDARCPTSPAPAAGGQWVARRYVGNGRYVVHKVGIADDLTDGDGIAVFDFSQAQTAARALFIEAAQRDKGVPNTVTPYTVANAIEAYLNEGHRTGKKALSTAEGAARAHILPALGHIAIEDLTAETLQSWRDDIARSPARLRSSPGKPALRPQNDPRARKNTANRILAVLRAALNLAWRKGKVESDVEWRKVKPFDNVSAPVMRYLTEAEATRLLNACPPDFRKLVAGALATAMRYGELVSLRVADVNLDSGTVLVRLAKSGRPRHVYLTAEGRGLFEGLVAGRPGNDTVFLRDDGRPWSRAHQGRPLRKACQHASIAPAISFHILRHTWASMMATKAVDLPVIAAQFGHGDTRVTERHYAHLGPSYIADTIRSAGVSFGLASGTETPVPLPRRRR